MSRTSNRVRATIASFLKGAIRASGHRSRRTIWAASVSNRRLSNRWPMVPLDRFARASMTLESKSRSAASIWEASAEARNHQATHKEPTTSETSRAVTVPSSPATAGFRRHQRQATPIDPTRRARIGSSLRKRPRSSARSSADP